MGFNYSNYFVVAGDNMFQTYTYNGSFKHCHNTHIRLFFFDALHHISIETKT